MTDPSPSSTFWRDRAVAVTGGTGFLGSHVVDELTRAGARVVVLVRDQVPESPITERWRGKVATMPGSVDDQAAVERLLGEYEVRTVLHLAAQSQVGVANRNPVSTFEANVAGTWALLEATRHSPAVEQVLVASSDKAYGTQPTLPYHEDMPLLARNPYDVSKACADLITSSYRDVFDVPVTTTRCGNLYGPGDLNWNRIVPGVVRWLLRGERPQLRSDGSMVRDYLHVTDAAAAYLLIAERMAADPSSVGPAYNLSTEEPVSVLELVRRITTATGVDLEPEVLGIATNEIPEQFLSAARARTELGWEPRFRLDDGLADTVDWYRSHLAALPSG